MACGGVESFILRVGAYLRGKGCMVDIITTQSPGKQFSEIEDHHLCGYSITCTQYAIPILHANKIAAILRDNTYNIIFINNCLLTQIIAGQLPDECIVITMIHGNINWLFRQFLTNEEAINLYIGISPAIITRAQTILKIRQIAYIPHGFDIPNETSRTNKNPPSQSQITLFFAGRLEDEDKGVFLLPEILSYLRNSGISASLRIAGAGSCQEQMLAKFEAFHMREHVEMLGYLSKADICAQYREAHVLLFPSRHEGFGLSLIEAMAHGCVPVSSLIPGVTDSIITHGRDGLLAPIGDTQAFADAIATLCHGPESWQAMSAAGRNKVTDHFSFKKMGDAYWQIVTKAMEGEFALPAARHLLPRYDKRLLRPRHFIPDWLLQLFVRFSAHRGIAATGIDQLWQTENSD